MTRTFESGPARRVGLPLMIGAAGATGAGKTKSALRLAAGIARVTPGPIVVIDTEAMRATMHADSHQFIHVPFAPPFSPLDYIAAIKHGLTYKPSTLIVDSMSHEWEGEGGVLAQQAAVVQAKGQSHAMAAWIEPKRQHRELKNFILQQRTHFIFCFRAKEKTVPGEGRGDKPVDMGWCALAAEDLIFEMLINVLLLPGVDGVPTWRSQKLGEQALMKLPGWFRDLFSKPRQLDEDIGEQLARWAAGGDAVPRSTSEPTRPHSGDAQPWEALVRRFDTCTELRAFVALDAEMRADWAKFPKGEPRALIEKAFKAAQIRTKDATPPPANDGPPEMTQDEIDEIRRQESAGAR